MSVSFLYLSCEEVKKAAPSYEDVIDAIENGMRAEHEGKVIMPKKVSLRFPEKKGGFLNSLPAYLIDNDVAGIKWVSGFEGAKEQGLPFIMGIIILNNAHTGAPVAIMDGTFITEMRTASVSAVAAKYLAKKDPTRLGIIGCGVMGHAHLAAMNVLFNFTEIWCCDVQERAVESFVRQNRDQMSATFHPVRTADEVLAHSEIVCTCTVPSAPFLRCESVSAGAFAASIEGRQVWLDDEYPRFDKVCVDKWASFKEGTHLKKVIEKGLIKDEDIYAELPGLCAGAATGRESNEERILFLSRGLGMEDVLLSQLVYENAKRLGVGQMLTLI